MTAPIWAEAMDRLPTSRMEAALVAAGMDPDPATWTPEDVGRAGDILDRLWGGLMLYGKRHGVWTTIDGAERQLASGGPEFDGDARMADVARAFVAAGRPAGLAGGGAQPFFLRVDLPDGTAALADLVDEGEGLLWRASRYASPAAAEEGMEPIEGGDMRPLPMAGAAAEDAEALYARLA